MARPVAKQTRLSASPGARSAVRRRRYEIDLHGWSEDQVALLSAGRLDEIDAANIAEELRDVGSEQYDKLESALEMLLMHLLKWDHQPQRRSRGWTLTIAEQRKRVDRQLRKNSSLKPRFDEAVEEAFDLGRLRAAREADLDLATLPESCPYDREAILSREIRIDG